MTLIGFYQIMFFYKKISPKIQEIDVVLTKRNSIYTYQLHLNKESRKLQVLSYNAWEKGCWQYEQESKFWKYELKIHQKHLNEFSSFQHAENLHWPTFAKLQQVGKSGHCAILEAFKIVRGKLVLSQGFAHKKILSF